MDKKEYDTLLRVARYQMRSMGRLDLIEDFAHYLWQQRQKGWQQTNRQAAIDFIRETAGSWRSEASKAFHTGQVSIEEIRNVASVDFYKMWNTVEAVHAEYIKPYFRGPHHVIAVLYFLFDWDLKSIALLFGVSESRMSQRMKEIKKEMQNVLKFHKAPKVRFKGDM